METSGFIGVGTMGSGLVANLLRAGFAAPARSARGSNRLGMGLVRAAAREAVAFGPAASCP
jgi:3-hydroxyisobutyrate dehydrogenase-like beta-hydroxyacid dehydrogenase